MHAFILYAFIGADCPGRLLHAGDTAMSKPITALPCWSAHLTGKTDDKHVNKQTLVVSALKRSKPEKAKRTKDVRVGR